MCLPPSRRGLVSSRGCTGPQVGRGSQCLHAFLVPLALFPLLLQLLHDGLKALRHGVQGTVVNALEQPKTNSTLSLAPHPAATCFPTSRRAQDGACKREDHARHPAMLPLYASTGIHGKICPHIS